MVIELNQTIKTIERCLLEDGAGGIERFHKAYRQTLRLQSQLLGVIYDMETFSAAAQQKGETLVRAQSCGKNEGSTVTLTIHEPLPSMKKLTEALEEHWKAMIHAAVSEAA